MHDYPIADWELELTIFCPDGGFRLACCSHGLEAELKYHLDKPNSAQFIGVDPLVDSPSRYHL